MAGIEKRVSPGGKATYRVKVRLKGFPVQTATFERKTDAKKWAQDTESAIRNNRHFKTAEAKRHTVLEMVDRFIEYELPKIPKVKAIMSSQLRWWGKQIGYKTLADISASDIAEARDKLLKTGKGRAGGSMAPSTVNRYLTALSVAFSAAVNEWGWLEDTPMRKVKKLREPIERVRFLSDEERKTLLEACRNSENPYLYTIVVLALSTGARKSELLGLRWGDVDLVRGVIHLEVTKNRERRGLPVRSLALDLLKEHSKVRRLGSNLVFPSFRNQTKPIYIDHPWRVALRAANIDDFRFHDLRHSTASYLAMNGASLSEIAEVLGHKTLQMVKRYAHISETHTAGVVASMNEKIFGSTK